MIPEDRLRNIPEDRRVHHMFCFAVHDRMVEVIRQYEAARVADVHIRFPDEATQRAFEAAANPVKFLMETGAEQVAKRIILNHVVLPLFADVLHFLHETLKAFENRKYAVAFALMRKALKYDLMFATWLLADPDDFYAEMASPAKDMDDRAIQPKRRRALLAEAVRRIDAGGLFNAETIYGLVFDRKRADGLAAYFDLAAHLVTSNPAYPTEEFNLNFIFKNPSDTDVYYGVYDRLAYLVLYLFLLELAIFDRMEPIPEWYGTWAAFTALGAFASLFNANDTSYLDILNRGYRDYLRCIVCAEVIAISHDNAPLLFLNEELACGACGREQQFPLFWLMARAGHRENHEPVDEGSKQSPDADRV